MQGLRFRVQGAECRGVAYRVWGCRIQGCEAVPRRARVSSSQTFVSLNSRLESIKEAEKYRVLAVPAPRRTPPGELASRAEANVEGWVYG